MTTSSSVSRETRFDGVGVCYDSAKSYEELVAALLADIGERAVSINDFARATGSCDSYRERAWNPTSGQADSCCSA